jgi:hypothetical protein
MFLPACTNYSYAVQATDLGGFLPFTAGVFFLLKVDNGVDTV